jgi:hypothetical protein
MIKGGEDALTFRSVIVGPKYIDDIQNEKRYEMWEKGRSFFHHVVLPERRAEPF